MPPRNIRLPISHQYPMNNTPFFGACEGFFFASFYCFFCLDGRPVKGVKTAGSYRRTYRNVIICVIPASTRWVAQTGSAHPSFSTARHKTPGRSWAVNFNNPAHHPKLASPHPDRTRTLALTPTPTPSFLGGLRSARKVCGIQGTSEVHRRVSYACREFVAGG